MEIKSIEELNTYLSQDWLLKDNNEGAEYLLKNKFKDLAQLILENVAILKGNKLYFIKDIEFYFYTDNHRDIITYPRNCKAGEWFFHPSGVDIAFESHVDTDVNTKHKRKPVLNENAKFGGILIREIYPAENEVQEDGAIISLDGPMKLMDALFNNFNAIGTLSDFPHLVLDTTPRGKAIHRGNGLRHNLLPAKKSSEQKVNSIMENYNNDKKYVEREGLVSCFKDFLEAPYRFILSDK